MGGHRFLMNAYEGSFTFQTIDGGGHEFFFGNPNPKISRFNTRRGYFFIISVNSFMVQYRKQCFNMFKVTLFIYLCVWKRGGMLFSSP